MTAVVIKAFDGLAPAISPRLLDNNKAQTATNCLLENGKLVPLKGLSASVKAIAGSQTFIWRYGNTASDTADWFTSPYSGSSVMRSPVIDDSYKRLYWNIASDTSELRYAPTTSLFASGLGPFGTTYTLGVNAPATTPSASCAAGTATLENRGYCCTYVTAYGEEGPPSAVSSLIVINQGARVTLSSMPTAGITEKNITHKRLYRTVPGSDSASFRLTPVTWPSGAWGAANTTPTVDIPLAVGTVYDDATGDTLQDELQSQSWYAPPAMVGLCMGGNGIAAGFTIPASGGHSILCFSEPYMPHAWPPEYQKGTGSMVVALVPFAGNSWAVLTTSNPYIATGSDPASISLERMTQPQSCVSKRSAVSTGDGVIYASPDGLCLLTTSGVQMLTEKLYSRAQWQALTPSTMHSYLFNGKVLVFHSAGVLIFDFSGKGAVLTTSSLTCSGGYYDPISDELYLISGSTIVKWVGGSNQTLTWRSKVYSLPKPTTLAWAQIEADAYPVTATLYGDGSQLNYTHPGTGLPTAFSITAADREPVRLPALGKYRDIEIEISGTNTVHSIALAGTSQELAEI